jgi:hypothetical protein
MRLLVKNTRDMGLRLMDFHRKKDSRVMHLVCTSVPVLSRTRL